MSNLVVSSIRVGKWILSGLCRGALRWRRLFKKEPFSEETPGTEHLVVRGDSRIVLLSTQPMILKPSYSELLADLPHDTSAEQLVNAIQNLHLVKIGSPCVFPVDMYLRQLESSNTFSECTQSGTSSVQLALEVLGHTDQQDTAGNFILHFSRRHC
jgi:hypothetical protein